MNALATGHVSSTRGPAPHIQRRPHFVVSLGVLLPERRYVAQKQRRIGRFRSNKGGLRKTEREYMVDNLQGQPAETVFKVQFLKSLPLADFLQSERFLCFISLPWVPYLPCRDV